MSVVENYTFKLILVYGQMLKIGWSYRVPICYTRATPGTADCNAICIFKYDNTLMKINFALLDLK